MTVPGALWRRPVTFAALLLVALLASVAGAQGASAHDDLVTTTPTADAVVQTVPGAVTLTFVDPPLALGLAVVVTGPDGVDVAAGSPTQTESTVTQSIGAGSRAGLYTVRWRVTADDGHPTTGAFSFTALGAGGSAEAVAATTGSSGTSIRSRSSVLWLTTAVTGLVLLAAAAAGTRRRRVLAGPADRRVE